jgi:hypothetical protein
MKIVSLQKYLSFVSFSELDKADGTGIFIVHIDGHPIKEFQVKNKDDHFLVWLKAMRFIWDHPYLE